MANPKEVLSKVKASESSEKIKQLVAMCFTTRNLAQFFHWKTGSYAAHAASGDLYEDIIEKLDSIVECYQGKFGVIDGLGALSASIPECLCSHVKQEAEWVQANKTSISGGCDVIANMLDELGAIYLKTIYKLENLK